MNRWTARLLLAAAVLGGCTREPAAPPPAPAMAPHGDHQPHHGGLVMMRGELHYEVVFDPAGRAHQVFFTDATRRDLPPSIASAVALTIARANEPEEAIALSIDPAAGAWTGAGRPVLHPDATTARVAFTVNNDPYWIDLPFTVPVPGAPAGK
jgi:hypothetical protein